MHSRATQRAPDALRKKMAAFLMDSVYVLCSIVVATMLASLLIALFFLPQISQAVFRGKAGDRGIGRAMPAPPVLVGHLFGDPKYFWGPLVAPSRLSDSADACCGSDRGPLSPALSKAVAGRIKALREADPDNTAPIPYDLVTASGSISEPYISPAAAEYQVPRVARARSLDEQKVRGLVADATEGRLFGFMGKRRVDVLRANLALDAALAR